MGCVGVCVLARVCCLTGGMLDRGALRGVEACLQCGAMAAILQLCAVGFWGMVSWGSWGSQCPVYVGYCVFCLCVCVAVWSVL